MKYWNGLCRSVARRGGVSYTELRAMDVFEFFLTLVSFEKEIADEIEANNKAMKKK